MCVPCTHTRIHRRVFIYIRLFIKLNTSHNVAAHTQTHTRTNTHGHADARTPFQISCWRCINIIITSSSSSSPSASQQAVLPLLLLLLLCRTVVVIVFPAVGNLQTHTSTRERLSSTSLELSVCLSSRINCTRRSSRSSSLFALWRVSKYFCFLFSLRVDCAIRAITLTLRSEVTALSYSVSTQRSSAHLWRSHRLSLRSLSLSNSLSGTLRSARALS